MIFLDSNFSISYGFSIALTLLIILVSTIYTLRNILRIWRKGRPEPHSTDADTEEVDTVADVSDDKPVVVAGQKKTDMAGLEDIDPVEYCEHIQSEVKKAKQRITTKKIQDSLKLTSEQIEEEREIQRQQLQDIFKLMQTQNDKFGVNSMDDVKQQMKLYV